MTKNEENLTRNEIHILILCMNQFIYSARFDRRPKSIKIDIQNLKDKLRNMEEKL